MWSVRMCDLSAGVTIKTAKMKPKKSISIKSAPRLHRQGEQSTRSLDFKQKRATSHHNNSIENKKQLTSSASRQQPQQLANVTVAGNKAGHTCSGCNKLIKREKYLLSACDKFWHESCLKCDQCHAKLGELGSSLFVKSDLILCRQDFLDLFGPSCVCAVCEKLIRASEMVMRAKHNVYHLECFACQLCNQRFCVGDQFYLLENKVVCQYDYEDIQRSVQLTTEQHPIELEIDFRSPQSNDIQTNVSQFREDQPLNQQQQQQQPPASVLQELTARIDKPRVREEEDDEEEEEDDDDRDTDGTQENENDELATSLAAGKLTVDSTRAGLTSEVNEASPVVAEEELIILAAGRKNE